MNRRIRRPPQISPKSYYGSFREHATLTLIYYLGTDFRCNTTSVKLSVVRAVAEPFVMVAKPHPFTFG